MKEDTVAFLNFTKEPDFEKILTNPILDIAARFWETDRYEAFKTCYRSMRVLDDLVDNRKAEGTELSQHEIQLMKKMIGDWLDSFRKKKAYDSYQEELLETIERFKIPIMPWEHLAAAMIYDLEHDGFKSFLTFRRYAEGAAVAPASIFMHLCGVNERDNEFFKPDYDIRKEARPLALFSYLVHIVRDFQKDHLNHLNYFSDNLLDSYKLDRQTLYNIASGSQVTESFRELIGLYHESAFYYLKKARGTIDNISHKLLPRYHFSLEVIYQLYLQIFQRIDPKKGNFSSEELNPTAEEVNQRIQLTINNFMRTF